jgi:hypothetical protein
VAFARQEGHEGVVDHDLVRLGAQGPGEPVGEVTVGRGQDAGVLDEVADRGVGVELGDELAHVVDPPRLGPPLGDHEADAGGPAVRRGLLNAAVSITNVPALPIADDYREALAWDRYGGTRPFRSVKVVLREHACV